MGSSTSTKVGAKRICFPSDAMHVFVSKIHSSKMEKIWGRPLTRTKNFPPPPDENFPIGSIGIRTQTPDLRFVFESDVGRPRDGDVLRNIRVDGDMRFRRLPTGLSEITRKYSRSFPKKSNLPTRSFVVLPAEGAGLDRPRHTENVATCLP